MIRIGIAVLLLLLSLLTVFKAPTNFFWKVAIVVTEFPWIPIALTLILGIWGLWAPNYKWPLFAIHAVALILFSLPIVRTYSRVGNLDSELQQAFGKSSAPNQLKQPFSFWAMFTGISPKEIPYQSFTYKQLPERDLKIDYYPAQTSGKAPLIIIVHGGSWESGDSQQLPALNSYLAAKGYHVVSMNYRLAPKYQYPAPVEDLNDVLAYVNGKADEWNIDTSNIVLIGRSAGGQIALMAAYGQHIPQIKGVVAMYTPADMAWGARIKTNKLVLDADKVLDHYIGGTVEEAPEKYDAATAPQFIGKNTPPTLIIHGPIDAMVTYQHSVRLKKKLDEHHIPNYLLDLPTATHGCDYNFSGPSGQTSTYAIERFIVAVTKK